MTRKHIVVDALARVEGEGGVRITMRENRPPEVHLRIYEPPRFFEGFLRGRTIAEVPDITARICGICPVAYQVSSVAAIEDACDVEVGEPIQALRRLLYCGEWIESHALHVLMLHAPDFLGYQDVFQLAGDHPELVVRGLRLKKLGNEIMRVIGGREIHPVSVRIGGFWRVPARREMLALVPELMWAQGVARDLLRWTGTLTFPSFHRDYELVALRDEQRYAIERGRVVSNRGLDLPPRDFLQAITEEHVAHSNALHSRIVGRGAYVVGPMARLNLHFDQLPEDVRHEAERAGVRPPCLNPFRTITMRAVELLYACQEALALVEQYKPPDPPAVPVVPHASTGHGVSEAPRGVLYHRYRLDDAGVVQDARIVPPTAQNLRSIEEDLAEYVATRAELPLDTLTWQCEQAVRNYDPCISCATHALRVRITRG
jgi:sulfhydrogenase subunit alpha